MSTAKRLLAAVAVLVGLLLAASLALFGVVWWAFHDIGDDGSPEKLTWASAPASAAEIPAHPAEVRFWSVGLWAGDWRPMVAVRRDGRSRVHGLDVNGVAKDRPTPVLMDPADGGALVLRTWNGPFRIPLDGASAAAKRDAGPQARLIGQIERRSEGCCWTFKPGS